MWLVHTPICTGKQTTCPPSPYSTQPPKDVLVKLQEPPQKNPQNKDTKTLSKRLNQLDLNCPQVPLLFRTCEATYLHLRTLRNDQLSLPDMEITSQPFELIILRTRTLHLGRKRVTPERLTSQKNLVFPGGKKLTHFTSHLR